MEGNIINTLKDLHLTSKRRIEVKTHSNWIGIYMRQDDTKVYVSIKSRL